MSCLNSVFVENETLHVLGYISIERLKYIVERESIHRLENKRSLCIRITFFLQHLSKICSKTDT